MRTHLEGSQFLLLSDKQEDDEAAAGAHNCEGWEHFA